MAAARNWLYALNAELADAGVYAGTLTVAALVLHSEAAELAIGDQDAPAPDGHLADFPTVHPDQLADHYWDMYTRRDRVEQAHPVELTPTPTPTWRPLSGVGA
ncbi:hypothetical protein RM844_13190 [Streptomyces sp. DSM 44915]|uniref:Uncharacterized protein n=1 Tax=Streptomyces chisholmiae TaxID=3075540 RepID=A0ABU2JQH1_9ACTN|nr:hypothetical protein [Streptomyces sp. DSM 44915]MDT0267240.1 hypothetical protein [Streptomyces sp. DSM 44915]